MTAILGPSLEVVASCEAQWHRPTSFTPGVGVCACGRYVWQPTDRVELAVRAKEARRG